MYERGEGGGWGERGGGGVVWGGVEGESPGGAIENSPLDGAVNSEL